MRILLLLMSSDILWMAQEAQGSKNNPYVYNYSLICVFFSDVYGVLSFSFTIGASNGQVRVAATLDFELRSFYDLRVLATDADGRSTSAPLRISVININDALPTFEFDRYEAFVAERQTQLTPRIQVQVHLKCTFILIFKHVVHVTYCTLLMFWVYCGVDKL